MQRVEGAQTPYEAYCFHCRVTFPAESRACIHCGGRLARHGEPRVIGAPGAPPDLSPLPGPAGEAEDEAVSPAVRRFGGLALWALVALSALISNLCRG